MNRLIWKPPFRTIYTTIVLTLCVVFASNNVCTGQDKQVVKLTLSDAVAQALEGNANIKQAEESRLSSISEMRIAGFTTTYGIGSRTALERTPDDRGVSGIAFGDLTYENLLGTEASLEVSPFGMGSERGAVGLSIRHPLLSGKGALSSKAYLLAGARSNASIEQKQLYLTTQATVLNVIEAYYHAVLAREQVVVQEDAVKRAKEAYDGAFKRADAGLVAGIEVSRAEIRVARTEDQLNSQQQAARAAIDRLMYVIGSGVGQDIELVDGLPEIKITGDIPETPIDIPDQEEAIKIALANRAEFAVYDERMAESIRDLEYAKDQLKPRLDIVAGFNSYNIDSGLVSSSLIDRGSFRAGLELRLPLDKRIEQERVDTSQRQLDLLQTIRTYQMEQVVEQVRQAYRDIESSKASLRIMNSNLKVAEENEWQATRMVEEGLEDNRVILEAQDSISQVNSGLNSAKIELYLACINLKYAMGEDIIGIVMGSQ